MYGSEVSSWECEEQGKEISLKPQSIFWGGGGIIALQDITGRYVKDL